MPTDLVDISEGLDLTAAIVVGPRNGRNEFSLLLYPSLTFNDPKLSHQ